MNIQGCNNLTIDDLSSKTSEKENVVTSTRNELPDELLREIFKYLPIDAFKSVYQVSRQWNGVVNIGRVYQISMLIAGAKEIANSIQDDSEKDLAFLRIVKAELL